MDIDPYPATTQYSEWEQMFGSLESDNVETNENADNTPPGPSPKLSATIQNMSKALKRVKTKKSKQPSKKLNPSEPDDYDDDQAGKDKKLIKRTTERQSGKTKESIEKTKREMIIEKENLKTMQEEPKKVENPKKAKSTVEKLKEETDDEQEDEDDKQSNLHEFMTTKRCFQYYDISFMLIIIFIYIFISNVSKKGMCRFTEQNNLFITILKNLVNTLTLGGLGVVMYFVKPSDCAKSETCVKTESPHNLPPAAA